jgi:6-pyruvoyltetrahydropterin/6-carboxytetrahydropterin synthase
MYIVTKSFHFSAAHRLMHYDGPCRFVHGHNFIVTVKIGAEQPVDETTWFVYDFKQLKVFTKFVEETYDHAFLTQEGDEIGEYLQTKGHKVVFFSLPPSTENLVKRLFDEFTRLVKLPPGVFLHAVHVQETPTAGVEYTV